MISIKKMRQNNADEFLIDLKSVREVVVWCEKTKDYFKIRKSEILRSAQTKEIRYYITDTIFKVKRISMVIY